MAQTSFGRRVASAVLLCCLSFHLYAQDASVEAEYQKRIRANEEISPLGEDLLGDSVSLYNGSLSFSATDVTVPGNSALPVSIGRRFSVASGSWSFGHFGDWELDIPHISGTYASMSTNGWINAASGNDKFNRCSRFEAPPTAEGSTANGGFFEPYEFWHGVSLTTPSGGSEEVLLRTQQLAWQPTDSQSYPLVTTGRWMIRCLSSTATGEPGEAFLAVSPDGTQYRFDWMVRRPAPTIAKDYSVSTRGADETAPDAIRAGTYSLGRNEYWMLPTQVTDRYGNTVTYTYDSGTNADRWRLLSITASDGRSITLTYDGTSHRIKTATVGARTWTYSYDVANHLQQVLRPDNSKWTLALDGLRAPFMQYSTGTPTCTKTPAPGSFTPGNFNGTTSYSGTITHPSGATGTFTVGARHHGRSFMPARSGNCVPYTVPGQPGLIRGFEHDPEVFDSWSLTSKKIEGLGLPANGLEWTYVYSTAEPSAIGDACGASCSRTKTVEVTDPEGNKTTHTFGTKYQEDEGRLLRVDVWDAATQTVQRITTYRHRQTPSGAPYPDVVGQTFQETGDAYMSVRLFPQDRRQILQDSTIFTWEATAFDLYAEPTTVTKSSTLGHSRTETTVYSNNTVKWILGQVQSVTESSTGAVIQQNVYDPITANLTSKSTFGRPATTLTYYPDGTLASQTDGASHTTSFGSYSHGIAQTVTLPDTSVFSAMVNAYGEIETFTRPGNYSTHYAYDSMGRLRLIQQPTGDVPTWNDTTLSFAPMSVQEPGTGIPFGLWKQVVTTGNAKTEKYFDALWRPVLTRLSDAGNLNTTRRMTKREFDSDGREVFISYPDRAIGLLAVVPGTRTNYDALGRVRQIVADKEGNTTISTDVAYLAGFQKQVKDPRGNFTTSTFQAFDEPEESSPLVINAPLSVTTTITRDVFGKPKTMTRSGTYNGSPVSLTRSYVYDPQQRLCKTVEPESRATIQAYNSADLVQWKASGQALTSTTSCDQASVVASQKVNYSYDAANRLETTTYGDSSPSVTRHYTPDGLPETVTSDGSTWTTTYNNRRLSTGETLTLDSVNYPIGYTYTANGHVASLRYPDNSLVDYAPNALGEATKVGNYASGITTHPNGALASFTYGNGIVHATEQNTRGLPSRSQDGAVLDDSYTYDENANVSSIVDNLTGAFTRSMQYDALDRLVEASNGPLWGGAQSYDYDPLDNLRRSRTQALDWTSQYDPVTQRLSRITNTSGGTNVIVYGYDDRGRATSRTVGTAAQTFSIDLAERVSSVNPGLASYRYDGLGRRMTVTKSGVTTVQVYSQAGQLLYQSAPVVGNPDGIFRNGFQGPDPYPPVTGGNKRYVYLSRHLLAEDGTAGRLYHHTDGLGSPTRTTAPDGTPSARNLYQPYGWGPPATSTPGFAGHVADQETGLSYMQARYYDPFAGRFLAADPVAATSGGFNRYWYANNNPYRAVDPDGRQAIDRFNDAFAKDPQAFEAFAPYVTAVVPGYAAAECIAGGCGVLGWLGAAADAAPGAGKALSWLGKFSGVAKGATKAARAGPGKFAQVAEKMSDRAAVYQSKVTGTLPDVNYVVKDVKFDGYDAVRDVLLEAKGPGYGNFVKDGGYVKWFNGKDGLVEQALRQSKAANGVPIEWHFADKSAADATQALFNLQEVMGISIIHTP